MHRESELFLSNLHAKKNPPTPAPQPESKGPSGKGKDGVAGQGGAKSLPVYKTG